MNNKKKSNQHSWDKFLVDFVFVSLSLSRSLTLFVLIFNEFFNSSDRFQLKFAANCLICCLYCILYIGYTYDIWACERVCVCAYVFDLSWEKSVWCCLLFLLSLAISYNCSVSCHSDTKHFLSLLLPLSHILSFSLCPLCVPCTLLNSFFFLISRINSRIPNTVCTLPSFWMN